MLIHPTTITCLYTHQQSHAYTPNNNHMLIHPTTITCLYTQQQSHAYTPNNNHMLIHPATITCLYTQQQSHSYFLLFTDVIERLRDVITGMLREWASNNDGPTYRSDYLFLSVRYSPPQLLPGTRASRGCVRILSGGIRSTSRTGSTGLRPLGH